MEITITDDFDLEKIAKSGQIFRISKSRDDKCPSYSFISQNHYLEVKQISDNFYDFSCTEEEFDNCWHDFFDLDTSYKDIRTSAHGINSFVDMTLEYGKGLRILRQDMFEMVVTFIISQRKSMPAIATAINKLCLQFGEIEQPSRNKFYKFPTPSSLASANLDDICKCGTGYRAEYIRDAAQKVSSGEIDLSLLNKMDDDELFDKLCSIKGVGTKVANCIMLFGYHRTRRAPIDVWIQRVIDYDLNGENIFEKFEDNAGIIQQYLFYYKTNEK